MFLSFLRRPKMDISIVIDGDAGFPREPVNATITLTSSKNIEIRKATAYLECVEHYWSNEYNAGIKSNQLRRKSHNLVEISDQFLGEMTVRSGVPISEQVSLLIPGHGNRTVLGKSVRIEWHFRVIVDISGSKDGVAEQKLIVGALRDAERENVAEHEMPMPHAESEFGEGRLTLDSPSREFLLGDTVSGRLLVDASDDSQFDEVRVELVRSEKSGDMSSSDTVHVVNLETDARFRSGLSRELRFDLPIPSELIPSTFVSRSRVVWTVRGVLARRMWRDHTVEAEIKVR